MPAVSVWLRLIGKRHQSRRRSGDDGRDVIGRLASFEALTTRVGLRHRGHDLDVLLGHGDERNVVAMAEEVRDLLARDCCHSCHRSRQ